MTDVFVVAIRNEDLQLWLGAKENFAELLEYRDEMIRLRDVEDTILAALRAAESPPVASPDRVTKFIEANESVEFRLQLA